MNDHVNPIIARALAPFTPPEPDTADIVKRIASEPEMQRLIHKAAVDSICDRIREVGYASGPVKPSLVVDCPACYGGWRDTPTGVVMCGQCGETELADQYGAVAGNKIAVAIRLAERAGVVVPIRKPQEAA